MRRLFLAIAFAGWGAVVAFGLSRVETNIEDLFPWLPDNTPHRIEYADFLRRFGSDDVLIVSWEGCQLDDPRIPQLKQAVLQKESRWVRDVIDAPDLIEDLRRPPASLTRREAVDRLNSVLIGPDGKTTCLLLLLTTEGMRDRREAVSQIIRRAEASTGLKREELHLGGQPYVAYYSAGVTRDSLIWLSIPVAAIATFLAWWSLRSFRLMLLALLSSAFATLSAFALIPLAGYRVSGLLAALPSLVFVVTTSGVIHVTNYSMWLRRREDRFGEKLTPREHAWAVRRKAWTAVALSTVSTMLGTMSLIWSEYPAIRDFGLFSTVGIFITFFVQIGLVPSLLANTFRAEGATIAQDRFAGFFTYVFQFIVSWRKGVMIGVGLTTALLIVPLFQLEGRFSLNRMFSEGSEFVRNITWLEKNIGPIDATEVIVRMDTTAGTGFFGRVRRVQELETVLRDIPGISSTFSAVTMLPRLNESTHVVTLMLIRSALERKRDLLASGSHLSIDDSAEWWRITLRAPLFGGRSRDDLIHDIRSRVESLTGRWTDPPHVIYTGSSQIFYETQGDILRDFVSNFLLAFLQILVMLIIALGYITWSRAYSLGRNLWRSFAAGGLAMLPNIIPCIAVFGILAWIDRGIDIGMTVAACIALGIAVDDTSHFLINFHEYGRQTPSSQRALRTAYVQSATPVVQTALICGISMLPYVATSLVYLARFGLLLATLMIAAMLAELLLLPALLSTAAGRIFLPHRSRAASSPADGGRSDESKDSVLTP